ncbi:carboxypeptidase-like regulatory domain-containing protein, partial [Parapedobacter defluvii]
MNYLTYFTRGYTVLVVLFLVSAAAYGATVSHLPILQQTITGKVVGATDSLPLTGVTVAVKATSRGTTTDDNGNFSIEASKGETIIFTYLGYQDQEIEVGDEQVLSIALQPDDAQALEEVVVVGYGTLRRKEVTSAVATVRAEDFNAGGARSPMDLIQGKVAGLNITRTQGNNPNSGAAIQLRGVTSLTGSRTPLIVIDGIPGGSLDLLQQDDIESFDVLKDGSAAAIYGTRGNAGVILITTKKGREGEARFDYSTYVQREVVDRKPDFLKASDFRELISQGLISADQDFGASTDLYEELVNRQNVSQYHNFAASGGSANTNYRASVFFNDA